MFPQIERAVNSSQVISLYDSKSSDCSSSGSTECALGGLVMLLPRVFAKFRDLTCVLQLATEAIQFPQ